MTIPATGLLRPLPAKAGAVQRLDGEFQLGNTEGPAGSVPAPLPVAPAPATGKHRPPPASKRVP